MNIYKRKSPLTGKTSYGVDYTDPKGHRIQRIVAGDLKTARLVGAKIATDMVMGKYYDRMIQSEITIGELVKRYEEYFKVKKSYQTEAYHLNVIRCHFGDRTIASSIDQADCENFLRLRAAVIGVKGTVRTNATVNRELWALKRVFYKAVDWKLLVDNPASEVEPLPEPKKRVSYLEAHQARALVDAASKLPEKRLAPFILTALLTGMRKSEILDMRPEDLDFEKKTIHLPSTKNGESRYVPMSDRLASILITMPELFKGAGDMRYAFEVAKKRAGIPDSFRFHDLRHTFVTHMLDKGTAINVVADIVGHSLVSMVERYGHLLEGRRHEAVNAIEDIF